MFILVITFLIVLILFSSIKVNLIALKENKENKIIIKVIMLYGLIRLKKELGSFDIVKKEDEHDGKVEEDLEIKMKSDLWSEHEGYTDFMNIREKIEETIDFARNYRTVIDYTIDKTRLKTLFWKTEVGLDNAALTGFTTGMINILKSNVFVRVNNTKNKHKKVYFKIIPNFERKILKTNVRCIFTTKIGYIIIAGLKYHWIKFRKKRIHNE